jgi:hypothetical protein
MHIHFTVASGNSKTGPMLVTTQSEDTCPTSCPLKGSGCYASYGPIKLHWDRVSSGERSKNWDSFLNAIRQQQKGAMWRLSQAGDLPGKGNRIDTRRLSQIVDANRGRKGFTYTHKPLTKTNQAAIKDANERGFTINLSADNLAEADKKAALGIAPVVVVVPENPAEWPKKTPEGRPVVVCLHTTKGLTCTQCGLCAVAGRKSIVAFPAHGTGKRRVEAVVRTA